MSVSESNHLRDNFFKLNRELPIIAAVQFSSGCRKWSALHHAEEALATAAVCLMSGHHDCPTAITVNADKLENCLMSLTLSIQSLQKHAMLEKASKLRGKTSPPSC
ncbi:biofilm formation regulator BssR [Shigella sonnei]